MSGEFATKIAKVKSAMDTRYENKQSNKKTDISGSFTNDTDSYPTVQAVKTYVEGKGYLTQHQSLTDYVQKSETSGLIKNDGTIDTNTYLTEHQDLSDYIAKSVTSGLVKNDGTIDTNTYLTQHQSLDNYIEKSQTSGLVKNDGTIDTSTYLTQHQDLSDYIAKSQTSGLVKNDGTIDTNTYLTQHQSLSDIGGEVAVTEKSSANEGAFKTYQITQDGTSVGEIDIPKDFLVKSGSVKTVGSTPTTAETTAGLDTGDLYISLIVNTKDSVSSSGNEELIIPAAGLVTDTTYDADNSTLQVSNANVFSIKASGVDTTQIKDGAVTADKINSAVKSSWLSAADVQAEINQALDDLAELINPTVQGS